jgi:hypothetical protein
LRTLDLAKNGPGVDDILPLVTADDPNLDRLRAKTVLIILNRLVYNF